MSPDIEWHIGDESERETIARLPYSPTSRRRWAVILAAGLGVGLGLLYRSIPEPSPKPITPPLPPVVALPAATPLPISEPLEAAIQRDAFRLATAAGEANHWVTFDPALGHMPQAYADWYAGLQNVYSRWGQEASQTLITVFETGTLPSGVVWVNLRQFRNDNFYHVTRFYRQKDHRWVWVLPDESFWDGPLAEVSTGDTSRIGPLSIRHPLEDAPAISAVFERFLRAYLNLCNNLQCPHPPGSIPAWEPGLTLRITILPTIMSVEMWEQRGVLYIYAPSPRVVGYYEDANTRGDAFTAMAYDTLIDPVVRLASGDYLRWETDHGGELFLQAIAIWKRARVREKLQPLELFYPATFPPPPLAPSVAGQPISQRERYANALRHESLLPLDALWSWPTQGRGFGLLQHIAVDEVEAIVAYLEDRYGEDGVVHFLNALGQARSLEEAVETALPIGYVQFNRQWQQWIRGDQPSRAAPAVQ